MMDTKQVKKIAGKEVKSHENAYAQNGGWRQNQQRHAQVWSQHGEGDEPTQCWTG
jgi:hypothetical protein